MKSYLHGHEIIFHADQWKYRDTMQPTIENPNRPCKYCGAEIDEIDHCIGLLPGVINACCGHGRGEGYIHFENGTIIRGKFTVEKEGFHEKNYRL